MTTDKPRFRTFQISIPCSGFIIDSTVRPIHPNARVILVEYPNPPYILVILTPVKRGMSIDAFEVTELPGHERIRELNMCYQALDPILGLIHARNELTEKRALIERLLQSPIAPKGSEA